MTTAVTLDEEIKQRFKQEALASWAEYLETGQHLTGEEVCDWFKGWGTDEEMGVSECHELFL